MSDTVNQPSHYTGKGDIECIDALRSALGEDNFVHGFCLGNAIKYIWRAGRKGSFTEDIRKAIWYLRMAVGDDPRKDVTLPPNPRNGDTTCPHCRELYRDHFGWKPDMPADAVFACPKRT